MTSRILMIALLAGAAGLSSCGLQGDLDRPAPLYGSKAKAEYEKEKAAGTLQSGNARPNESGEDNAGDATDVVVPAPDTAQTTPLPPRTAPITGQSPDPFRAGPPGALPDPYNNPDRSR